MTECGDDPVLDFASGEARAGFRLQRFELYNWGTFHNRVWPLRLDGDNGLLTGDIGSGKSTLVDALTTLLVPAHRITYNKAAGAGAKERTLRSYVLGYYKSERDESALSAKAVALRGANDYSVILGHFFNEGYGQDVTLAQVFWIEKGDGQPERFWIVADRELSIAHDFAGFGPNINDLRARLRKTPGISVKESFPAYSAEFRRRFGIESDQALELFNQTVSMKSVGNLTDFVRGHMLETTMDGTRIAELIAHFNDLDRAHQAVLKAKGQIEALEPLIEDVDRHADIVASLDELRKCREALRPWFAHLKSDLLLHRISRLDGEIERLAVQVARLTEQHRGLSGQRDQIKQAIAENGGDRLERLKAQIETLGGQQDERRRRAEAYAALARQLGLGDALDAATFLENRHEAEQRLALIEEEQSEIQNRLTEAEVSRRKHVERHRELNAELVSLRQHRSNIPAAMLQLRERLCTALDLPVEVLPFVGELVQVRESERDWEGAIERVLHNFGLSLLVPDTRYRQVNDWVDRTHLRGRLVYYRVLDRHEAFPLSLNRDSLVRKLEIRAESAFYRWLERQLAERFDYTCCTALEQFRREKRALTRAGQTKTEGQRHEKDDRRALDDRTHYVLGWSNEAKIAAYERQAADLARQIDSADRQLKAIHHEHRQLREREGVLMQFVVYQEFGDLAWRPLTLDIQRLDDERRELESTSDVLHTLQTRLTEVERQREECQKQLEGARSEHAIAGSKRLEAGETREGLLLVLDATPDEAKGRYFPQLEAMRPEALGDHKLTVESCDNRQSDMRDWLQGRIDADEKKVARLLEKIVDAMRSYKNRWPLDTTEVDVSVEAAGEYRAMLDRLRADDLPRFEARFKALLNENTIREIAGFQAQLNREREDIRERIETINRSLRQIDYNPNRYIQLQAEFAQDADVREFRESLRACTEGALTGSEDEQYSEAKFLQVRAIIERFRGREGLTELDARWTRKVTDVRNWFVFSASERWKEDDVEYEHYTDSGGKSGGQKEKLAYTVLAASLAYQFGLEWGEQRSRSFRFVVIDEAFGRGSDESTRYGLELFKLLNLQLLVVTPLQKIHVIESFVANVGFVHNEDGRRSLLRNLTIEEYHAEQEARRAIKVL